MPLQSATPGRKGTPCIITVLPNTPESRSVLQLTIRALVGSTVLDRLLTSMAFIGRGHSRKVGLMPGDFWPWSFHAVDDMSGIPNRRFAMMAKSYLSCHGRQGCGKHALSENPCFRHHQQSKPQHTSVALRSNSTMQDNIVSLHCHKNCQSWSHEIIFVFVAEARDCSEILLNKMITDNSTDVEGLLIVVLGFLSHPYYSDYSGNRSCL